MDLLHISGVMINMDGSWNDDRNESSPEPDPVSQSYLDICAIRNGQTCGGTEVVTAGSNTVAVHHELFSSNCPSSVVYRPAKVQDRIAV